MTAEGVVASVDDARMVEGLRVAPGDDIRLVEGLEDSN
jgi:hypothetical protein